MPSGFMPNGMVVNHSIAGSLALQYCGEPMNASMVPFEAASKHSNGGMIWPPGKTSIRNRPPLVSSTTFASRWAAPCITSNAAVQVVDMRHWTFGWAMTLRGVDDGRGPGGRQRPARLRDESASLHGIGASLSREGTSAVHGDLVSAHPATS